LGDVHAGNTGKMESFECHLGGRLTYALSGEGADCLAGFDDAPVYFFYVDVEEQSDLEVSYAVERVFYILLVTFV